MASMELPKIVSVDDHVVEPAHVWQTWLPQKYRAAGPRIERKRWGPFEHKPGARYVNTEDELAHLGHTPEELAPRYSRARRLLTMAMAQEESLRTPDMAKRLLTLRDRTAGRGTAG